MWWCVEDPRGASAAAMGKEGWQGGFTLWSVKFSRMQRVPRALLCLQVGEKGWCYLSLGREDSCSELAADWKATSGAFPSGDGIPSPGVLPFVSLYVFPYQSELQQAAAAGCPRSLLSEHILMTVSSHLFKHF